MKRGNIWLVDGKVWGQSVPQVWLAQVRPFRETPAILEKCLEPQLSNIRHKKSSFINSHISNDWFLHKWLKSTDFGGFDRVISYFIFISGSKNDRKSAA